MTDDSPTFGDCPPGDDIPISGDWDTAARVARLLEVVQRFATLDFSEAAPVGVTGDDLDALAAGINMLGEELEGWHADFEQRVAQRTAQLTAASAQLEAEVTERRRTEEQLAKANADLSEHVGHLRRLNNEISQLAEMSNLLQAAADTDEAFDVIGRFAPDIFTEASGAIYLTTTTRKHAEAVTTWRTPPAYAPTIQPADCVALRDGRTHHGHDDPGDGCSHLPPDPLGHTLCIPLASQSKVLGLLTLHVDGEESAQTVQPDDTPNSALMLEYERLALAAGEQLTLTLANLELRTELRTQAIRDALTGLYNRRYLDEILARELHRAQRTDLPVSVLMLDIDHFKDFNDTHGHAAGDTVLAAVAKILRDSIRSEDIACRYGGEEFIIILAGLAQPQAVQRAEQIRLHIAQQPFTRNDHPPGHLTVSIGTATRPQHGTDPDSLLRSADTALYRAKDHGRNRVETAP